MREIKFRAWNKSLGKMIENESFEGALGSLLSAIRFKSETHLVFMQFTGLKDKNGVEIYEGDELRNNLGDWVGKVIFDDGSFRVVAKHGQWTLNGLRAERCEVIGNVLEDRELLD